MANYPISNVARRVVYTGSAGVGPYAFSFEIINSGDVDVYKNDALLTLTTNYTVTINANGTGTVTLVVAATSTDRITIVGARTIERTTDFVTGGDLFANTLNQEIDSQTIFVQQVAETAERSIKAPVTDPTNINMTLPAKTTRAGTVLAFNATTGNPEVGPTIASVATVAAQSANINTVATNIASVNTVAGNNSNITTVGGNNSNISTVAGISANVTTVAGISSNVSTVATNNANVTTVAANIAAVNTNATNIVAIQNASTNATNAANSATAAGNAQTAAESARDATLAAFDSFDDRYLGTKTSNPTLDNDGNALLAGALYFNSVVGEMRVYTGSAWVAAYVSGTGFLVASNNLSDLNSVSTARTNLGLGTISTQASSNVSITGGAINGTTLGATTPSSGSFTSLTDSGNLTFTGTGNRITADFTNATVSSRTIFQTSTANSSTGIYALPSGTSTAASWQATNAADPTNASKILIATNGSTDVQLVSGINGSGTYLPMTFYNNGSEKMRLDTSGNLGIGTSSPSYRLEVVSPAGDFNTAVFRSGDATAANNAGGGFRNVSSATAGSRVAQFWLDADGANYSGGDYFYIEKLGNSGNVNLVQQSSSAMTFQTTGTERMRIDSSGNVGIGTSSPTTKLDNTGSFRSTGATDPTSGTGLELGYRSTFGDVLAYNRTSSAFVELQIRGAPIIFGNAGGERMRIDSSGNLLVGTTATINTSGVLISKGGAAGGGIIQLMKTGSGNTNGLLNYYGSTYVGGINFDNTSTSVATSSDIRLKKDVADAPSAINVANSIRVVSHGWKHDEATVKYGFVAQELINVVPEAVMQGDDGEEVKDTWTVDYARLVPILTKALQELKAELDVCKAEIAALKGAK